MAETTSDAPGRKSGGCLGRLLVLFVLGVTGCMALALYLLWQPQELDDVDGAGSAAALAPRRDLKAVVQSAIDRGYPVTISEEELNGYLARTLAVRQAGLLSEHVSLDGVWVRLEAGRAEIIMERRVLGRPFTLSAYVRIERTEELNGRATTRIIPNGGPIARGWPLPDRGGRFGRLVVPEGFLHLTLPAFRHLAEVFGTFTPEGWDGDLQLGAMANVRIDDGRLTLEPLSAEQAAPPKF